ncbi:ATP-binding protein [Endozoicomonas sp. 4G]|uniref:ATP-binding protein n=1 Tax=Endozoicomonas sp. 4G TaxID=2872754 RepID=UPI002078DF81|nr:ATP-binding protein [Endozoicomonas sp. 4G]
MNHPIQGVGSLSIQEKTQLAFQRRTQQALENTRDLVNKSYLAEMKHYDVIPTGSSTTTQLNRAGDVRIFRVERLVQENKQSVLESITATYTALGAAGYAVFLYLKSDQQDTLVYIGTRGEPGQMLGKNAGDLLQEAFKGHFPGSHLEPMDADAVNILLNGLNGEPNESSGTVTAVSSVPSLSTEDQEHFMQGLERFIDAAEGRAYQGLILAEPISMPALNTVRTGYEQVATQLSSIVKRQLSYGLQDSQSINESISLGLSQSLGESLGLTETKGSSETNTKSTSHTHTTSDSTSSPDKLGLLLGGAAVAGGTIAGGPLGAVVGGQLGSMFAKTHTTGTSDSSSSSDSYASSTSASTAHSRTTTATDTRSRTDSHSIGQTVGSTQQLSYEVTDKTVQGMLDKIDHHLNRINEAKSYGGWHTAAYFISDNAAASESLASLFLGLTRGSHSNSEDFAMTTWSHQQAKSITPWLAQLMHPRLSPAFKGNAHIQYLTPATLVSGKEMALQLSLPRRSTSTVVVQEAAAFGRTVQRVDSIKTSGSERILNLGHIRHLWSDLPQKIELDIDHLTGHTFVTGATGSGKSNTVYQLLSKLNQHNIPFMVIEPAKGEYKHVFGHHVDVRVLGTNHKHTELLKINPFSFPPDTHVLEHVDRLIEIFNVCWPMYAAMPAILKDAILQSYEQCGWDLITSETQTESFIFPTFADLLLQLERVIDSSSYSQELKSNYAGALLTRVKSLANGLNGQIFSSDELSNEVLFDHNVIVDLSRVGSQETKSLIMGLLIVKLSEYRAEQAEMNQPLKHVTVLEEAHNILQSSTSSGGEGSNIAEKSVEMISNAIAEMRTYGEGFIIADQSPSAVHLSAIRNTNTKVIMRLPDESDRQLAGRSAALSDDQLDELARLPRGVAAVYQNDWLEPVLCKVNRFLGKEQSYHYQSDDPDLWHEKQFRRDVVSWLVSPRCREGTAIDVETLKNGLVKSSMPTQLKLNLARYLSESECSKNIPIHEDSNFHKLSDLVATILDCNTSIDRVVTTSANLEQLHKGMQQLLRQELGELSAEIALTTEQALMKHISKRGEDYVQLYAGWNNHVRKSVVL